MFNGAAISAKSRTASVIFSELVLLLFYFRFSFLPLLLATSYTVIHRPPVMHRLRRHAYSVCYDGNDTCLLRSNTVGRLVSTAVLQFVRPRFREVYGTRHDHL